MNFVDKYPLVSIIIPTYNQDKFIAKAIESALAQEYNNLEIIVSDDNSIDQTEEVVKKYLLDERIIYFKNPQRLGRVGNYRRACYSYASGSWAVNLDGDDYYNSNSFISDGIRLINKYQALGEKVLFYQSGIIVESPHYKYESVPNISNGVQLVTGTDFFEKFFQFNASSHLTTLYNREKALEIDYYSKNTLFADLHSFLRLALNGSVILDKKICGVWNIHNDNQSKQLTKYFDAEIESRIEIAEYAKAFVAANVAESWLKLAVLQMKQNLIYKDISHDKVNIEDWKLLMKHFSFNTFSFKHLFKYFLMSFRQSIKRLLSSRKNI